MVELIQAVGWEGSEKAVIEEVTRELAMKEVAFYGGRGVRDPGGKDKGRQNQGAEQTEPREE